MPATVPLWPDAARLLGIGRNQAYEMADARTLPVPAWKPGLRWVVPTAHLMRHLGIPVPGERQDARPAGAEVLDEILGGAYLLVPAAHLRKVLEGPAGDAGGDAVTPTPLRHTV